MKYSTKGCYLLTSNSGYLLKITEAPHEQLQTAAFRLKLQKAYAQDLRLLEQRKRAVCDA